MAEPVLQLFQTPTHTSVAERRDLWTKAFDHFRPTMAFAHVSLVLDDRPRLRGGRRARQTGLALLEAARDRSLPLALPAEDGGPPLGQHVELDDPAVVATLRNLGPHLLRVQLFAEPARRLLRDGDAGAALPLADFDDFGEILTVHLPLAELPLFLPVHADISEAPPDPSTRWQKPKAKR